MHYNTIQENVFLPVQKNINVFNKGYSHELNVIENQSCLLWIQLSVFVFQIFKIFLENKCVNECSMNGWVIHEL